MKKSEFERGFEWAKDAIEKGESIHALRNQCYGDLDAFHRGALSAIDLYQESKTKVAIDEQSLVSTLQSLSQSGRLDLKVDMSDGRGYYDKGDVVRVNVSLHIDDGQICSGSDSYTISMD